MADGLQAKVREIRSPSFRGVADLLHELILPPPTSQ